MSLDTATGAQLDRLANDHYGLNRTPNESDAQFRRRVLRAAGAMGHVVKVGPLRLHTPEEARKVYGILLRATGDAVKAIPRPLRIREALEQLVRAAPGQPWAMGTAEQIIYEIAEAFKAQGVLVDGVLLESGQRTSAWVNKEKLETWYAATVLFLDIDE